MSIFCEKPFSLLSHAYGIRQFLNDIYASTPDATYAGGMALFAQLITTKESRIDEELRNSRLETS